MDTLFVFFCVMLGITVYFRAMAKKAQQKKEDALLDSNPPAWETLQRIKMEKQDQDRRAIGGAAISIAEIFLKKQQGEQDLARPRVLQPTECWDGNCNNAFHRHDGDHRYPPGDNREHQPGNRVELLEEYREVWPKLEPEPENKNRNLETAIGTAIAIAKMFMKKKQ